MQVSKLSLISDEMQQHLKRWKVRGRWLTALWLGHAPTLNSGWAFCLIRNIWSWHMRRIQNIMLQWKLVVYNHNNITRLKVSPLRQANCATQNTLLILDIGYRSLKRGTVIPVMVCSGMFVLWFCVEIQGLEIDNNTQNFLKQLERITTEQITSKFVFFLNLPMYLLARTVIKFLHCTTCSLSSKSKKYPDGFPINSNPKQDIRNWSPFLVNIISFLLMKGLSHHLKQTC